MTFQVSDFKGRNFLDLLDNDLNPIELSSSKGSPWLSQFGHSNSLCAQASRAITNHAPIGEFQLKFFSREGFDCSCGFYPIETRHHILHKYHRCYDQCLLEKACTRAKDMMMTIGCTEVVSVSTSCSKCYNLITFSLLPHAVWFLCFMDYLWFHHVL